MYRVAESMGEGKGVQGYKRHQGYLIGYGNGLLEPYGRAGV
jgi:hypothetical protein